VTPVGGTTTTTIAATTTSRSVSPLEVIIIMGQTSDSNRTSVGMRFRTDSTALPQRVCWTVTVNNSAYTNLSVSSSDLNGAEWSDAGGGCASYVRTARSCDNSYWAYVQFEFRGSSYNPVPYVKRTWTARATIVDSLGRSAESSTYLTNL
jgi:hypothetical protein